MSLRLRCLAPLILLLFSTGLRAQPAWDVHPAEAERRNAASAFVFQRVAVLGMLRVECAAHPEPGYSTPEGIAQQWWGRNRADVEAAQAWTDRFMAHLGSDAAAARRASVELSAATASAVQEAAVTWFNGTEPNAQSCIRALQQYSATDMDIQQLGRASGQEGYTQFAQTLKRIRAEPGYRPLEGAQKLDFDKFVRYAPVASIEAARAALKRREASQAAAIYRRLARGGDGAAAQALGFMYLSGDLQPRDEAQAYAWFYNAFSLANYEGLNALGVMLRDGQAVPRDNRLAYGAFLVAAHLARDRGGLERARKNAQALAAQVTPEDRLSLKCMSLAQFDEALRRPLAGAKPDAVPSKPLVQGQRRLGELAPQLAQEQPQACS
jgi:TPR repeat protein